MVQGSIINHLMKNSKQTKPEVGMGVTALYYTDRHAGTIVEVISDKRIVVQEDIATRTDQNGMSESQSYDYTPNPKAARQVVTLRKNGRWVKQGSKMQHGPAFQIGYRNTYHDYGF
jgi:hypothetical protein